MRRFSPKKSCGLENNIIIEGIILKNIRSGTYAGQIIREIHPGS
jgi:hypothetical protein